MKRGQILVQVLLLALAARGLAPQALDPWRAWVTFKQYARDVQETPDPGVSVQLTPDDAAGVARLVLLRQDVEARDDCLAPIGGVVCELTFPALRRPVIEWDAWSFDHRTFERFVDVVEQYPAFQDLIVQRPLSSAVYWEDA